MRARTVSLDGIIKLAAPGMGSDGAGTGRGYGKGIGE